MRNQKKASGFGKDLITDINCVAGWEADFVIYLETDHQNLRLG